LVEKRQFVANGYTPFGDGAICSFPDWPNGKVGEGRFFQNFVAPIPKNLTTLEKKAAKCRLFLR
jgi:hypothetical protein